MSTESDVAAEIASELASLQAEQGSAEVAEPEEAAPEADSVESDPEADEPSEEIETEEGAPADAEAFRAELAELIDAGDLRAAAAKLGLDPSVFKLDNRQFKAARVTAREAKAKAAEALAAQQRAEKLQADAEAVYGPIVAGGHAYKAGDMAKARAALELLFEDDADAVIAALSGKDQPADTEVAKLRRELAAERASKAEEKAATAAAEQEAAQVAGITAKLKGTPLEELGDEAAREIHAAIKASYNPALKKHTVTLKEAYRQVKASYAAKAAKLAKLAGTPTAPAKPSDRREPLGRPRVPAKQITPEDEFAAELAAAKRETAAAVRRQKRSR